MTALSCKIRDLVDDDWSFVLSSWKKSFRDGGGDKWVPAHIYFAEMHARIEGLKTDGARFRVACDPEDEAFIWGWACTSPGGASVPTVHYVYVRQASRHHGIARRLLVDAGFRAEKGSGNGSQTYPMACSHWTHHCEEIMADHPGALFYAPSRRAA